MKFDHPEYKNVSFELPNKWTVRKVLDYDSALELSTAAKDNMYVRLWNAAISVVEAGDWHIKEVPLEIDIDEIHASNVLEIIKFVGLAGYSARNAQEPEEKN